MALKIGAYSRISLDWEGEGLGVARQRADSMKLAALRGWTISEFYTDNNISAFKADIKRPEFERLLDDLSAGRLDGLIAYDLDRIARQPVDLERIIRIYEQRTGLVFATVQGSIDLSTSDGLTMARVMVTFANKSSMDTSRRTKRKNLERAESGLPHGGHRPYGYNSDLVSLHPQEAPVLHEVGLRFTSGSSYHELADWLNGDVYQTTTGRPWLSITVANMLARPRYGGLRVHLGQTYPGQWEPVFTPTEYDAIQYLIKHRREVAGNRPAAKKYLLTGLAVCGSCGGYLNGETKRDHPSRPLRRTYHCRGCMGLTRNAEALDHFIREAVCYRLDTDNLSALLGGPDDSLQPLLAERDQLSLRKNALVDDYADGTLNKPDYLRASGRVMSRLEEIDRQLDRRRGERLNVNIKAGQTVREAWLANPNGWRRAVMSVLIDAIVVSPGITKPFYMADGKRYRFDPELIEIKWRV